MAKVNIGNTLESDAESAVAQAAIKEGVSLLGQLFNWLKQRKKKSGAKDPKVTP
jgi:hypothetical protein